MGIIITKLANGNVEITGGNQSYTLSPAMHSFRDKSISIDGANVLSDGKAVDVYRASNVDKVVRQDGTEILNPTGDELYFECKENLFYLVGGEPTPPVGAIQFTTAPFQFMKHPIFTPAIGFSTSFKCDWISEQGSFYFANDSTRFNNNSILIWQESQNNVQVNIRASGTNYQTNFGDLNYGDEIKLTYLASETWTVHLNGVLQDTFNTVGYIPSNKFLVWGNYQDVIPPVYGSNSKIWDVNVNTESWLFDEQTGTTATGSESTVITLEPNTANGGSTTTMWASSLPFTSTTSFLFDFRAGNGEQSRKQSYYDGQFIQNKMIVNNYDGNLASSNVIKYGAYRIGNHEVGGVLDNEAPVFTTQNIGGLHGWDGEIFTVVGHGKTIVDDIYSVWDNGGNEIILWNIDGDDLYMTVRGVSNGSPIGAGVYTHVSGATNTGSFTLGSGANTYTYPSTKSIYKRVYIDGVTKNTSVSAIYTVTDRVELKEQYDIIDEQSLKDWYVTQQGTGVVAATAGGTSSIRLTNTYGLDRTSIVDGIQTFKALLEVPVFDHTKFLQNINFASSGDDWYFPKTKGFTDTNGTFNFSNLTPYQSIGTSIPFNLAKYEVANEPPDRQLTILNNDNRVFVQGFLPVETAGLTNRINNVNRAHELSSGDQKLYMRGQTSDKVGTVIPLNTTWNVYSYKGVIPKVAGRTSSYFVTDSRNGTGYMYADWHTLPTTDAISVPTEYQGKAFTVIDKTSNVTLADGTLGSTLSVSVAATHNYGFVTIEIAV